MVGEWVGTHLLCRAGLPSLQAAACMLARRVTSAPQMRAGCDASQACPTAGPHISSVPCPAPCLDVQSACTPRCCAWRSAMWRASASWAGAACHQLSTNSWCGQGAAPTLGDLRLRSTAYLALLVHPTCSPMHGNSCGARRGSPATQPAACCGSWQPHRNPRRRPKTQHSTTMFTSKPICSFSVP